jgi:hypothetical protein
MEKILGLENKEEWNCYLDKLDSKDKDIYFTPEYYSLYEEYGDGVAKCFVFTDKENILLYPFLLNSINVLGYKLSENYYDIQGAYGYNGLISNSREINFISSFYSCFRDFCLRNNIIAEFLRFHPLLNNHLISDSFLDVVYNRNVVFVDLCSEKKEVIQGIKASTRRNIKKGERNLEIKILQKNFNINEFINIYSHTMQRVKSDNYLYFNEKYFRDLFELDNVICFEAYYNGKLAGAAISFIYGDYLHYHLGASYDEFLIYRPNDFIFYNMILYGLEKKCRRLFFGGGTSGNSNDSLLRYKSNFSPNIVPFYIGKKIYNESIYNEIIKQWEGLCPNGEKYEKILLKYRCL